jgi:hypothetical protein
MDNAKKSYAKDDLAKFTARKKKLPVETRIAQGYVKSSQSRSLKTAMLRFNVFFQRKADRKYLNVAVALRHSHTLKTSSQRCCTAQKKIKYFLPD